MRVRTYRIALVASVAVVILGLAGTVFLVRDRDDGPELELFPVPMNATSRTPTPDELAEALQTINAAPELQGIAGGQRVSLHLEGAVFADRFLVTYVQWTASVVSHGPWRIPRCRSTRVRTEFGRWIDLRGLLVGVDLEAGSVISWTPGGSLGTYDSDGSDYRPPRCPDGFDDD